METGTLVRVSDLSQADAEKSTKTMIFLYELNSQFVCQEEDKFHDGKLGSGLYRFRYIYKPPKPTAFVRDILTVATWLVNNGFEPTDTGIWRNQAGGGFFRDVFFKCGKPVVAGDVWPPELIECK